MGAAADAVKAGSKAGKAGTKAGNLKKYNSNADANLQARAQGYKDAHDLKENIVGKGNVSKFDMYRDSKTGEIFLKEKSGSTLVETGLYHI